jgi:purine-cytosine permease-like protein
MTAERIVTDVADEAEGAVVVREGEYGDRVLAVEPGGIGYIRDEERHGGPLRLFWTWNSANWEFATFFVGAVPIAVFGVGFWPTLVAVVLGEALGCAAIGLLSTWGPKFGVPQFVQSRGPFGFFGNMLPAALQALTAGVGWFAVNTIGGAFALGTLTHLSFQISLLIIVLAQIVVAFFGHNLIHQFEQLVFPYLVIVWSLTVLFILAQSNPGRGFNPNAPVPFAGPVGGFILAFFIAFSYGVSWSQYGMDYARYLPRNVNRRSVFWSAMLGAFIPCAVLQIAGAALVTVAGTSWGPTDSPTDQLVKPLPAVLAWLTLFGVAIGAVTANVLNVYSSSMSFLALGIRFGHLHWQRALVAVVIGVIGYFVALGGQRDAGHSYENFLLVIGYWITPWLAVEIVDYWLRRGRYPLSEFYAHHHNPFAGLTAMLIGILASVPFWNQALWQGPVARSMPQLGDLSFLVGFLVAGVAYYALKRGARTVPGATESPALP